MAQHGWSGPMWSGEARLCSGVARQAGSGQPWRGASLAGQCQARRGTAGRVGIGADSHDEARQGEAGLAGHERTVLVR